jgi:hypothetical protein
VRYSKIKYGLVIFFFTWAADSFGQTDSTNLYFQALKYYNEYLDKHCPDEKEIYIEANNGITEKLPGQIGQRTVTIMTSENQKGIYTRNGNKIRHVKMFPARTKDSLIEINITPYFGEYKGKKKGYNLGVSNWVTIQFKFDCTKNEFRYFNTKTGGI